MELASHSLSHSMLPKPPTSSCSCSLSPSFFHCKSTSLLCNSLPFHSSKSFLRRIQLQGVGVRGRGRRNLGPIHASDQSQNFSSDAANADRWLLDPVGDGDSKHIGFKVPMPDAFEIVSNEVTVGRLPEKADIVIPVATVSASHARIRKKDGNLYVTDLDSTNGTFIDEKRLRPGVVAPVSPGSLLIFGDIHLAMFRVSKLKNVDDAIASKAEDSDKVETEEPTTSTTLAN